jgi:hypothetical protein
MKGMKGLKAGYPADTGPPPRPDQHLQSRKIMADPHLHYLAHHWIILAGPAFLPAIVVVGIVLYIAIKDRRSDDPAKRGSGDDRND